MKQLKPTSQFKKDLKKISKNTKRRVGIEVLQNEIIPCLQIGGVLDKRFLDHPLCGTNPVERDCHVLNDLVLVYRTDNDFIYLIRLGTHSELFG